MAGKKIRKMTLPQLRKELKALSAEELAELVEGLYRACPDAAEYLNIRFGEEAYEEALLADLTDRMEDCFYTKGGRPRLDLQEARSLIGCIERVSPHTDSHVALKLVYLECGMEIIRDYVRLPESLYRGVEQMAGSVVKDLNGVRDAEEGRRLKLKYEARLKALYDDQGQQSDYFYRQLETIFRGITWGQAVSPSADEKASPVSPGQAGGAVPAKAAEERALITDSSNVLPEEDRKRFFRLFLPLLDHTNRKLKINQLRPLEGPAAMNTGAAMQVAEALWADPSLIDAFLLEQGNAFSHQEQEILRDWKGCVRGRFIVERHLKKGSIMISMENGSVYLVRGIQSSLEEMFSRYSLPLLVEASLLPYKGVIITDGLMGIMDVVLGGGVKKQLKDAYTAAKRQNRIITSI